MSGGRTMGSPDWQGCSRHWQVEAPPSSPLFPQHPTSTPRELCVAELMAAGWGSGAEVRASQGAGGIEEARRDHGKAFRNKKGLFSKSH